MAFCENCGAQLQPDALFCVECGNKILNQYPEQKVALSKVSQSYIESSFVDLSENEVKVKSYHCTTLKRPQAEGYITVTNKRVVFHGYGSSSGGKSKLVSEVPIENISGLSTYYGYGLNKLYIILGAIFGFLCLYSFTKALDSPYGGGAYKTISLFLFVPALLFFLFSRKEGFFLSIYSSGANGTPINIGGGVFGSKLTGQGAAMSVFAKKTDETELMMNELGAIILDLKTMGDHAIEKWSSESKKRERESTLNNNTQSLATNVNDEEYFK